MSNSCVRLTHAAMDEQGSEIILRGRIDPETFDHLLVDAYQREVGSKKKITDIINGFKVERGSIPDTDLGMRGERYSDNRDGEFILEDPTYIIDGLQRITAAKQLYALDFQPWLGAVVHFNTDEEYERKRFHVLNAQRTRVSSNILLRNLESEIEVVHVLLRLCEDIKFVMADRVSWKQNQRRQHLISGGTLVRVVGRLHTHLGRVSYSSVIAMLPGLNGVMEKIGKNVFRSNVRTFFDAIDQCWGVRSVAYVDAATHLRHSFLVALADVFGRHMNFWHGDRLDIDSDTIRKLKSFQINDPDVRRLAMSLSGTGPSMLSRYLVDHINSGRRTHRLEERS